MPYDENNPLFKLSQDQLDEIGREFDKLHEEVKSDLGDADARYIRNMIQLQRRLVAMSRVVLLFSKFKPAWVLGTAGLSVAKILENM
jgi:NADPH-dependent stearoyl-CoA 9-desaturase